MTAADLLTDALRPPFRPGEIRWITLPVGDTGDAAAAVAAELTGSRAIPVRPAAPAEALLRLDAAEPAVFWDGARLGPVAGWGAALTVAGHGAGRFQQVRRAAERLWPRLEAATAPGVDPLPPRLFGGFSFLPSPPPAPWSAFGAATFVLPRLLYAPGPADRDARPGADPAEAGSRAGADSSDHPATPPRLAVAARAADAREDGPERLAALVARTLTLLAGDRANGARPAPALQAVDAPSPAGWADALASIRGRIEAGEADKIVAARKREIRFAGAIDALAVLRALAGGSAAEARFAFRHGGATFLGATPERLISRRGLAVATEALAGSIDADRAERDAELLHSLKDAEEHGYVVRAIADALEPLCDQLDYPEAPGIRHLRHVLHLRTPFNGRLARAVHVLELVDRLHPTPAVGGTPAGEAVAWIAAHEPWSRGWYASPVGWFDAAGDGEFVVALRSALVDGDRAHLYAGAGVVRDSETEAELAETEVKLRTMADALGTGA